MAVIQVGSATASAGETAFGTIGAGETNDGAGIEIPIAIVRGKEDGPILWIQNGVHGTEYVGMGAIQRVLRTINPAKMKGSIVAIPMVNILALRAGSRSASQDGLDMNRIYPGNPLETAMHVFAHSEIVVDRIFRALKSTATHLIDCHAGGSNTTMAPYAQYFLGGKTEAESAALAKVSGMALVWPTEAGFVSEKAPNSLKVWSDREGIPGIALEQGGQARLAEDEVVGMTTGILNIMKHLGIIDGEPVPAKRQLTVRKGHWLRPSTGGAIWRQVDPLEPVMKGQPIHIVTDLLGRVKETLVAPADGVVVGIRTLGTVNSGEYCGNIGEVEEA